MSSAAVGALAAGGVCLLVSPYLARLTLSAGDRDDRSWWRGRSASPRRTAVTALAAAVVGALGGIAAGGLTAPFPALLLLALAAAPLIVIDYESHRLPNRLVFLVALGAPVLAVVAAASTGRWHDLLRAVEGGAAVFAALFTLRFVSPGSFGYGDVKLGGVLGAYLGWFGWAYVYYGIFGGFLLGAVVAVALLASGRADRKTPIAFGPPLIVGALLVVAFDLVPSLR